jgi:tRNA-splicing ligase RtcB
MLPPFNMKAQAINCHHNFAQKEDHFGANVWVTRKGAVQAGVGMLGIIPGSMGAKSFIVRGKGNPDSFQSCSHGAGRRMSRSEAKRRYLDEDAFQVNKDTRWTKNADTDRAPNKHMIEATMGVECRKDNSVVDEIPMAYKDIDQVMAAQTDLVEIVATLKQVLCIKG